MEIWPAIDLRGGKCVRLQQGDYDRETVFAEEPARMAEQWVSEGAEYLHLVDLDGARDGKVINRDAIGGILQAVSIPCELGGGIRDRETIAAWLELGLQRVVVGTKAVEDEKWFRDMAAAFPNQLVLGIDARNGHVATDGWLKTSEMKAVEFAQAFDSLPLAAIVYTDIAKDGMLAGPNLPAMAEMKSATNLPVVASGGITSIDDVAQLAKIGMDGAIIGRALYEGRLQLSDALQAARV